MIIKNINYISPRLNDSAIESIPDSKVVMNFMKKKRI